MRSAGLAVIAALACPSAVAGSLEAGIHLGGTIPFYSQSFRYDPGAVTAPLPGVSIEQRGSFGLDARGAAALGGHLAIQVNSVLGLEARIDTADLQVDVLPARYQVRADLPAPLPDLSTEVELGTGTVDLERVRPVSLNLRLRTPGRVRLRLSAGVSYLPALGIVAGQTVGLGVTGVDARRAGVDVAVLALRARAAPDEDHGRIGGNAGVALHLPLSTRASVFAEARGFLFGRHRLTWERADSRPLSALEDALLREVQARLEPVRFNPTFFQLVAGIAIQL